MAYHRILVAPRAFGKGVQKEKLYSLITPTRLSIPSFPLEDAAKTILDEWIELHLCTEQYPAV